MPWYYFLLACLLLGACGDKPKPAPGQEPPARSAAVDTRPVLAAFGDSLTAGFGVDPGETYPDFLQKDLDRRGLRYRVVNAGISGDTSTDGLARLDTVLALKPAVVVLEFGANDGLRGLPVATTRANLDAMIRPLRDSGAKIVLAGMTLPPNYGPDYIRAFEKVYRDLASEYRLRLIPFLLAGVAGTTEYMQRDGLHPNVEGYRKVAATVMQALEGL